MWEILNIKRQPTAKKSEDYEAKIAPLEDKSINAIK